MFKPVALIVGAMTAASVAIGTPTAVNAMQETQVQNIVEQAGGGEGSELREIISEYFDKEAVLADILDVDVETVEQAKEDRTLRDLIDESGVSVEELRAAMDEAFQDAVDEALADGAITAEQAEQLAERGTGRRGGPGGRRGPGGNGGPDGAPPAEEQS